MNQKQLEARLRLSHSSQLFTRFMVVFVLGLWVFVISAAGQTKDSKLPSDCSGHESVPLPADAENVTIPKTPPACASYRSYRGIGRPVNYSEARVCAWQERLAQKANLGQNEQEPIAWVIGGSLVLADIYFNGAGVKRNIPLGMRFACEFEESAAMLALKRIKYLHGPGSSMIVHDGGPLELCEYAASTFTMNFCAGYKAEIVDARTAEYFNSLQTSMTPGQRSAFQNLLAAQRSFIEAHIAEVDQGGTIRVMRTMGSQAILKNRFYREIVRFELKSWPKISRKQVDSSDDLVRHEFEKKLKELASRTPEEVNQGAVTANQLSKVQKSWETFRDAWLAFAGLRYPDAADQIRAEINLDRYLYLKTIH